MSKYAGNIITTGANAGYSVAFNGSTDYLTAPDNAAFDFGSGAFTVQWWEYRNGAKNDVSPISRRVNVSGSSNRIWTFNYESGGNLTSYFDDGAGTVYLTITAGAAYYYQWNHYAVTRSGNTITIYRNGVSINTGTLTQTLPAGGQALPIGLMQSGYYFNGYIAGVQIIKGTAIYTGNFTPPTLLFPSSAPGASPSWSSGLLACQSSTIIDNSSNSFTLTQYGTPKVSTLTPFTAYSATPPNPNTQSNTSGVWSVTEAEYWMAQNQWPMPYPRQSLRFNSADSAYLNRTPASAGNRQKFTFSAWLKYTNTAGYFYPITAGPDNNTTSVIAISDNGGSLNDNCLSFYDYQSGAFTTRLVSTQVFRDVGAWYHVVLSVDTTQATATNRVKLYLNGFQITAFSASTYPAQNTNLVMNNTVAHIIGSYSNTRYRYTDGYLADVNLVDGQALDPTSFGQTDATTGAWIPQNYTGSYGTNGFRLTFQNNTGTTATTLGKDWSGQGNNWTPNNFNVTAGTLNDSLVDSPWNFGVDNGLGGEVRGNYCTWNPLIACPQNNCTIADGNLSLSAANINSYQGALSTYAFNKGKWYVEVLIGTDTGSSFSLGIINSESLSGVNAATYGYGQVSDAWLRSHGGIIYSNASTYASGLPTLTMGDTMIMAVDFDNGKLWFGKNGVWDSGSPAAGTSPSVTFTVGSKFFYICWQDYYAGNGYANFGQRPWSFTPPTGFKAVVSTNIATPAVGATSTTLANKNFDATLYTGTGASLSVTNAGTFQPDLVWLKSRSNALDNKLTDVLRGATKGLISNTTGAETTDTNGLTAFNSGGFTVGSDATYNTNATTYVGWQWKAGGTGVSNTAGSITSTVSANTSAGFSVVTYTGTGVNATIGHGLGAVPKMIISKSRNNLNGDAGFWPVYHVSLSSAADFLKLNTTDSALTGTTVWNSTAPTSTVYSVGTASGTNAGSSATYVAYVFAEVAGFSKFGKYTGNGSTNGPFIYTGFRPRWILLKSITSGADGWFIFDTARDTYNVATNYLLPASSAAEASTTAIDILSNGFKVRSAASGFNTSSGTYIYAAFAETPFNYSRAR